MSLCVENLKTRKTVSFETISSIQQRFWDLSTQRIPIVLKKSFESRKVLFEVKKLSFLLHGHNSYNVWEWKTVNCKGIFVNWRSSRIFVLFCLSFFFNEYYLAFLLLFCHACHASSVTTQFSIVARYHGIDFPCDLGIVIVLSCSLVKTLSRFTAKIYFE